VTKESISASLRPDIFRQTKFAANEAQFMNKLNKLKKSGAFEHIRKGKRKINPA
jgi:hypothetical protein